MTSCSVDSLSCLLVYVDSIRSVMRRCFITVDDSHAVCCCPHRPLESTRHTTRADPCSSNKVQFSFIFSVFTFICHFSKYLNVSVYAFHLGSCDIYSLPEVKGQAPKAGEVPTYVNTQHIDTQVLAALQGESETLSDSGTSGTAKDSPRKDLFDMSTSYSRFISNTAVRFTAPSVGDT